MTYTVVSLFTGIGGMDLGFERAGFKVIAQVENDDFCNSVLERRFPGTFRQRDVRECGANSLPACDVLIGGVPCQPASNAGRRKGTADSRWLWPDTIRIASELRPRVCVFENVSGLRTLDHGHSFREIIGCLAKAGYLCEWFHLRASDVGAPHRRERIFIVAYTECTERGTDGNGQLRDEGQHALWTDGQESAARSEIGSELGNTANQGLPQPGQGELASLETQSTTGLVIQPERPGGVGQADAQRAGLAFGQSITDDGRQEQSPAERSGGDDLPNADGQQANGLAIAWPERGDGPTQPGLGGVSSRLAGGVDELRQRSRWPARPGEAQHTWEPPRTTTSRQPKRAARLKALGNACLPQVAEPIAQTVRHWLEEQDRT